MQAFFLQAIRAEGKPVGTATGMWGVEVSVTDCGCTIIHKGGIRPQTPSLSCLINFFLLYPFFFFFFQMMTSGFSWEWVSVWSYYLWSLSFWCWKNQLGKGITCVTFFPLFPTHAFLPEYFKVNYRNGSFSLCSALPEGSCTHWSHCCRKGYLWIPQHGRKQLKEQKWFPHWS